MGIDTNNNNSVITTTATTSSTATTTNYMLSVLLGLEELEYVELQQAHNSSIRGRQHPAC